MGGVERFAYPKAPYHPTGGWWLPTPKNARRNASFVYGAFFGISLCIYYIGKQHETVYSAPKHESTMSTHKH